MDTIFIASHVKFIDQKGTHGPAHAISDYLRGKKNDYVFVQFCLDGIHSTQTEYFFTEQKSFKENIRKQPRNSLFNFRVVHEIRVLFNLMKGKRYHLFIGIDPLNALYGLICKKFGKVDHVIFYTADYAIKRFRNPFINFFYHRIDRWCIRKVDAVWNVSSRITTLRTKQGVSDNRNFFVPNAPSFYDVPRKALKNINRYRLVVVANLIPAIDYRLIIESMHQLRERFSAVCLYIIGDGPTRPELETFIDKLGLRDVVRILGRKDRNEVLEIMSECAVGLAPYTSECSWTEFGDSKKAREYLACGLPVIMNRVVSTADDIEKYEAGIIITLTRADLLDALERLLGDDVTYQRMRSNALRVAQMYDLGSILDRVFNMMAFSI